jgi:cellulose biosynthesis protein BcsQ
MISTDYLIIPSDLKAFANEGLVNVKNFIADINEFRDQMGLLPVNILGVLPCKIPTYSRYVEYTLPSRKKIIQERYNLPLMDSCVFQREDLAKCVDKTVVKNDLEIPAPMSVLDYKRDSASAEEFENLATEIIKKVG